MSLSTIYTICAIAGVAVLVLRLVLLAIGLDHGDAPDISVESADDALGSHEGGMNLLSMQSIAGFFAMFGLVGLGLLQIKAPEIWTLLGALVAGGLTAWATTLIFVQMLRLRSEGTMVISDAIGQVGSVYLTIPENGSGVVSVTVRGALRSLDAVSENGTKIVTGSMVRVVGISAGKTLIVVEQSTDHT